MKKLMSIFLITSLFTCVADAMLPRFLHNEDISWIKTPITSHTYRDEPEHPDLIAMLSKASSAIVSLFSLQQGVEEKKRNKGKEKIK